MNLNDFNKWLWTDAGAGWVVGGIGLILTLWTSISAYILRKKPNRVFCKEIDKFTLVKIKKSVKENISINYKNRSVINLAQIEVELINTGLDTIKNLQILFSFDSKTKILDVVTSKTSDVNGKRVFNDDNNTMVMTLPYLNSYKEHKSKVTVSIVCDGSIDSFKVIGGGEGWSLIHKKLPTKRQFEVRVLIFIFLLLIEALFFIPTVTFIKIKNASNFYNFNISLVGILSLIMFVITYVVGSFQVLGFRLKNGKFFSTIDHFTFPN